MNLAPSLPGDLDSQVLQEAAEWMVLLHSGEAGEAERQQLQLWQQRSPAHREAWGRAEAFFHDLQALPAGLARDALARPGKGRRRALGKLLLLGAVAPTAAWLGWRGLEQLSAGEALRTATGERREFRMTDGTRLTLNTGSRVRVLYSDTQRLLRLEAGEIHIDTAPDTLAAARPFLVQSREGLARALGTRFTVRQEEESSRVAVFAGAVEISGQGWRRVLGSGEHARFTAAAMAAPATAEAGTDDAWRFGMFLARNLPLGELAAELERYRPGLLRCHPAVAGLRVSGAFPVDDVDRSLRLLEETFPLRVRYRTAYWATLEARERN